LTVLCFVFCFVFLIAAVKQVGFGLTVLCFVFCVTGGGSLRGGGVGGLEELQFISKGDNVLSIYVHNMATSVLPATRSITCSLTLLYLPNTRYPPRKAATKEWNWYGWDCNDAISDVRLLYSRTNSAKFLECVNVASRMACILLWRLEQCTGIMSQLVT